MASNLMSRLLPSTSDETSSQPNRVVSQESDTDHTDDMALDEENLGGHFENQDLEALLAEAAGSEISERSAATRATDKGGGRPLASGPPRITPKWMQNNPRTKAAQEEQDDEVPVSLMLENHRDTSPVKGRNQRRRSNETPYELPPPVPGPVSGNTKAQWETTKRQQRLHDNRPTPVTHTRGAGRGAPHLPVTADPKARALWKWAQVDNLDKFLGDVYNYYDQKGIWSIILRQCLMLLTAAFGLYFVTFCLYCINWTKLSHAHQLSDIQVEHCSRNLPWYMNVIIWVSTGVWIWSASSLIRTLPRLWDMHNFYHHLLGIPDKDMQSVTWQYVVRCLMDLRDQNMLTADQKALSAENRRWLKGQSKQRMDAHDIANRLMRKENYWIAIINRDILDCSVQIPFLGRRQFYTKTMEWNLGVAISSWVFDENTGQIKPEFLNSRNRANLVNTLKKRFRQVAIYNCFFCIIGVVIFVILRFLTSFTEYQRNPTSIGAREWTPVATWKLREFNELDHFFVRRKVLAKRYTDEYMDQFPKDKTAQLARFGAFITGALLAVLGMVTLFDSELFLGFEIRGKTVLFWLGVLGGAWNLFRGMIPADDTVHDPEFWIERVIECTHYKPKSWENKLYSEDVLRDMSALYKLEIILFLEELASVIFVPIVFWWRLPNCAEQLVDFFREFTIHVDGLGHVCSFAVFDFKSGNQTHHKATQKQGDLRADYFGAKDNKLAESYQTFMLDYGDAPRKGLGNNRNKRGQFHLPPVFPGLAASRLQPNLAASMHYTPRMAPTGSTAHLAFSPTHSVLLDPHHQPRASYHSPRQGPQLRHRGGAASRVQTLDADPDEHDEDDVRPLPQRTPSNILEEDSDLGDSWAVKADVGIQGSSNKEKKAEGDGVGVLGLLYQFQKAQTEGRGVNI
ncbi:uncharacterized protein PV09_03528 [Verruconis gallopava]|uniref:Autophagy-related protein 9 n=1 Tax=Verruconis gallopava TaxID=253628 RepID=A0A0D2B2X6_9PEZI|nr:uncharacterized protein PV09_03528 [Verruconis gallopava]KIW05664.1 hypothetical protein PV09_03528 [Verruconis gallopava]